MTEHNRTPEEIEDSLKHWKEDWRKLDLFEGIYHFCEIFSQENCSLCDEDCYTCPLPLEDELSPYRLACSTRNAPYENAYKAYTKGDKKAFHRQRWRIIKRLERAQHRMIKEAE